MLQAEQKTFGNHEVESDLIVDTDTLYVDASANNVGIGTTAPVSPLEVIGDITLENDEIISNSSDDAVIIKDDDSSPYITFSPTGTTVAGNNERVTGTTNGEYIDFETDGEVRFYDGNDTLYATIGTNVGIGASTPTSTLEVEGSLAFDSDTIINTDSPYTLTAATSILLCDTTSGAITVNLPAASDVTNRVHAIKNVGDAGNDVTVDGSGAETIDDDATVTLFDYETIDVSSDGGNWWIY